MSKQQGPFDLAELRGQIAVVTGAGNNGIGWGLARHAATRLGMHVALVDLHEPLVRAAAARLQEECPEQQILGVACDVTRPDALAACLETVRAAMPNLPIGAVFANAGVIFGHTILKSTVEEWTTTLNVNVLGVVNTIKTFVPELQSQSTSSVICPTASVGGLVRGDGGGAAYQASKHAVVALTESLSFELARKSPQIRVHVLCPCIVQTALGATSRLNQAVAKGEHDSIELAPGRVAGNDLAMTVERHAEQVFDHIAAGHFYAVTENVRPYVDHDFPFDAAGIIRERMDNMLQLTLDNADALKQSDGVPSAILKGPMFAELKRRRGD